MAGNLGVGASRHLGGSVLTKDQVLCNSAFKSIGTGILYRKIGTTKHYTGQEHLFTVLIASDTQRIYLTNANAHLFTPYEVGQ